MAMKLDLNCPGQFKMLGEQTNLAQKWDQYGKGSSTILKRRT